MTMLRIWKLILEIDDLARYVGYFLLSVLIAIAGIMLLMRGEDWNYWSFGLVLIGIGGPGVVILRRRIFEIIEKSGASDEDESAA
jgi:hypothetical protein